jgi:hypothetical protein
MIYASLFNLGFPQFIQNSLFLGSPSDLFWAHFGPSCKLPRSPVQGRLGEPLCQVELFYMQNTLERYVAEGLAVHRLLVVQNREVRFYSCDARKDCRKSSAELLMTNEAVFTNSPRVYETRSTALLLQPLPQRIFALYRQQKLPVLHLDDVHVRLRHFGRQAWTLRLKSIHNKPVCRQSKSERGRPSS